MEGGHDLPGKIPENFDGFITPDGELISIDAADRMYTLLLKSTENAVELSRVLRGFAEKCLEQGRLQGACAYLEKAFPLVESDEEKAGCLLMMGQAQEGLCDYRAAGTTYRRAFELPQENNGTWYFPYNNIAYCLDAEGRRDEAEKHCCAAIRINRKCHNAHKNLGIALEGQGRYMDAARSYMRAARLCSTDRRAIELLKRMMCTHEEVFAGSPDILARPDKCQEAIDSLTGRHRVH